MFADARQRFDHAALRALVANFADPAVGAVSGELILGTNRDAPLPVRARRSTGGTKSLFDRARAGSTRQSAPRGAIYAIRRELFEPIPEDTILDDVLIPLRIVRRGYRVVFEPDARAYDQVVGDGPRGVRPKGAHDRRHLSAVRARAVAVQPAAESPVVRDALAQGAAAHHSGAAGPAARRAISRSRTSGRTAGSSRPNWRVTPRRSWAARDAKGGGADDRQRPSHDLPAELGHYRRVRSDGDPSPARHVGARFAALAPPPPARRCRTRVDARAQLRPVHQTWTGCWRRKSTRSTAVPIVTSPIVAFTSKKTACTRRPWPARFALV